jgi:hypothetical protein
VTIAIFGKGWKEILRGARTAAHEFARHSNAVDANFTNYAKVPNQAVITDPALPANVS